MSGIPTPKFSIGDTVYWATTIDGSENHQCPDCLGSGKWKVTSPAGGEWDHECIRCRGRKELSLRSAAPFVRRLTIGSIRIDTAERRDHPVSYMCQETGIGSGSIYPEDKLHESEASAEAAAKILAAEKNKRLDESEHTGPDRARFRFLMEYQLTDAKVKEAEEKAETWRRRFDRLMYRVCELDTCPVARWDGELRSTSLVQQQVEVIQETLVYLDEYMAKRLEDYREESECRC